MEFAFDVNKFYSLTRAACSPDRFCARPSRGSRTAPFAVLTKNQIDRDRWYRRSSDRFSLKCFAIENRHHRRSRVAGIGTEMSVDDDEADLVLPETIDVRGEEGVRGNDGPKIARQT
ncbi:hypothetical protein K0M31_010889 [Melipona bicolor]|uniref:Uncharacterized protein n=1 Tax=Melipona bicolor TaxID=60889 RepID=A0AA40KI16_9HYME|nr:hypothetical protein K0M31_010889 [Melipona bicolor]